MPILVVQTKSRDAFASKTLDWHQALYTNAIKDITDCNTKLSLQKFIGTHFREL